MSGHSKWATTKHQKAVVDARRAKSFAKLIKNIEVAARIGGGDVDGNPTLFDAIQKAKKTSVPKDNIERAVKRGSGAEGGGTDYETLMYEAYGPAGIALLIVTLLLGLLLAVPALILFAADLGTAGIVASIVAGLILLPLLLVASGALGAFNHSYWTLAYLRLTAPTEEIPPTSATEG